MYAASEGGGVGREGAEWGGTFYGQAGALRTFKGRELVEYNRGPRRLPPPTSPRLLILVLECKISLAKFVLLVCFVSLSFFSCCMLCFCVLFFGLRSIFVQHFLLFFLRVLQKSRRSRVVPVRSSPLFFCCPFTVGPVAVETTRSVVYFLVFGVHKWCNTIKMVRQLYSWAAMAFCSFSRVKQLRCLLDFSVEKIDRHYHHDHVKQSRLLWYSGNHTATSMSWLFLRALLFEDYLVYVYLMRVWENRPTDIPTNRPADIIFYSIILKLSDFINILFLERA